MNQNTSDRSILSFYSKTEIERMARREYQDCPLKQTTGKRAFWYIRPRVREIGKDGLVGRQQKRIFLGFCHEMGEREAKKIRAAKLAEINGQLYTMSSHIVLSEFVKIYSEKHLPTIGPAAQAKYKTQLTNHILPAFGSWKMSEITTEQIQAFLNRCKAKGMSWWTCSDIRNIISGIFTRAARWGYWKERNPAEWATCGPKREKREKRILSDEDTARLIEALPEPTKLIAAICASTGMRVSEVLGLRWKNVDLETGWLRVAERNYRGNQDTTKTIKSQRDLPLGDLTEDLLLLLEKDGHNSSEGYVFHSQTGEPLNYNNLRTRYIVPTAKELGLYFEGFGFHSLRRGLITAVQEVGGSAIEAQRIAGHSRPDMTTEYSITSRRRREELIRARQERLRSNAEAAANLTRHKELTENNAQALPAVDHRQLTPEEREDHQIRLYAGLFGSL